VVSTQRSLFEPDLPSGFRYRAELIGTDYEERLLDEIARVEFALRDAWRGGAPTRRFLRRLVRSGRRSTYTRLPTGSPRESRVVVWRRVGGVRNGVEQRVPARLAGGTATRRSATLRYSITFRTRRNSGDLE
jgi:hypothetical protein